MEQTQLILSEPEIEDALDSLIEQLGGKQKVGHRLRPDKDPIEAGRWLANCLNKAKRDKLDVIDVIRLLRAGQMHGYHEAKYYLDYITGYQPSAPRSIAEEKEDLMRKITANQDVLQKQLMELGALTVREKGEW